MDQRKSACAWMSACVCGCECVWMSVCVQERGREEGEETCNRLFRSTFGVSESFFVCCRNAKKLPFISVSFGQSQRVPEFHFLPHCRAKVSTEKKWPKLEFEEEPKQAVVVVV